MVRYKLTPKNFRSQLIGKFSQVNIIFKTLHILGDNLIKKKMESTFMAQCMKVKIKASIKNSLKQVSRIHLNH